MRECVIHDSDKQRDRQSEGCRNARSFDGQNALICGVPGEVRTHNLPLRRGMLYPIELLGHAGGSMLASLGAFVMLVHEASDNYMHTELKQHIARLAICMTLTQLILQSALRIFDIHQYVFDLQRFYFRKPLAWEVLNYLNVKRRRRQCYAQPTYSALPSWPLPRSRCSRTSQMRSQCRRCRKRPRRPLQDFRCLQAPSAATR